MDATILQALSIVGSIMLAGALLATFSERD